jgi:hypothetical protein
VANTKGLEKIRAQVDEADGVLTMPMWELRDAYGKQRLGVHVRASISRALKGMGLGHFPERGPDGELLPYSQYADIRLYRLGSPIADFIDAVLEPSEDHDEELRQASSGGAAEILNQVREIVCG